MAAPQDYVRPELFDEGGPAPPLVRVGCSRRSARRSARRDTLSDDPHVAADTPAVDSEVRNSYLLFIPISLQ
jgi:hypothetical protein